MSFFHHFFNRTSTTSITTSTLTVDEIIAKFEIIEAKHKTSVTTFTPSQVTTNSTHCCLAYDNLDANRKATTAEVKLALFETPLLTVYTCTKGPHITLAYKGTLSLINLMTNFTALPLFTHALFPAQINKGSYFHKGFLDVFTSTWSQVKAFLEAHVAKQGLKLADLDFTLTGHSLGGAQATLALLHLAHLVTSPSTQLLHIMSSAIATHLNELLGVCILRTAKNDIDIVTMVAPGFLGFKHVGINLAVRKPTGVLPHVMEGYMAGVASLDLNMFILMFILGVRRSLLFALHRLLLQSL